MSEAWTTERVREMFLDDGGQAEYYDPINGAREQRRIAGDIFDRWMTEHDRLVAERAWEEGARWAAVEFGKDDSMDESRVGLVPSDNPYRKEQENNNA